MESKKGISIFQKYLSVWVIICMVIGVLLGRFLPQVPAFLNRFEYARVSVPMAILIWLMIYPMMKVDFQSVKNVGKNPKGLFVTWVTNWLIKPFSIHFSLETAEKYDAAASPTIVFFKNGEEQDRIRGFVCEEIIAEKISELI